jgi:hypothetical protein
VRKVVIDFRQHSENQPGSTLQGDVWEFIKAMERFQRETGRRYPSWSEVLQVVKALGYRRSDLTQEIQP